MHAVEDDEEDYPIRLTAPKPIAGREQRSELCLLDVLGERDLDAAEQRGSHVVDECANVASAVISTTSMALISIVMPMTRSIPT